MNFIKADVNLVNGTQGTMLLYSSASNVESTTSTSIESNKTTSLVFPTEEKYFVIKFGNNLFFQFFYADLKDNETFAIFFGINNNSNKYSCTLINTNTQKKENAEGIQTELSLKQLNINFSKYQKPQPITYIKAPNNEIYPDEIKF